VRLPDNPIRPPIVPVTRLASARLTRYPRMRAVRGWLIVYWALWAAFVMTAALNMLHMRAGFLTNYTADLVVPALLYVMLRGVADRDPRPTLLRRWFGRTPERAGTVVFLASAGTEWSQRNWPRGVFSGRYDPWDIAAFALGIVLCYVCDKWGLIPHPGMAN